MRVRTGTWWAAYSSDTMDTHPSVATVPSVKRACTPPARHASRPQPSMHVVMQNSRMPELTKLLWRSHHILHPSAPAARPLHAEVVWQHPARRIRAISSPMRSHDASIRKGLLSPSRQTQ